MVPFGFEEEQRNPDLAPFTDAEAEPPAKLCRKCVCLGPGDARHFRAKTRKPRKRAAKRENAKTRKPRKPRKRAAKRENAKIAKTAKTRTEVQERESWTAMIISGSGGTSMQNNYIALQ